MDIDEATLHETILSQPWCISMELTTTLNKVLLVTTNGQIHDAQDWADNTLLEIYNQNIADKIDITNLQHLTPHRLNKPILTAAGMDYANKLKQCSTYITTLTKPNTQFTHPPKSRVIKPTDLTYTSVIAQATQKQNTQLSSILAQTPTPTTQLTTTAPAFNYKAELKRISIGIETKLKPKLDPAIANLQSIDALEMKFEQKLN